MAEPLQVAGVVVISSKHEVLFLKRAENDEKYAGLWSIVAGTKEEGESIDDTAARELKEETGLIAEKENLSKLVEFDDFILLPERKIPMHVTLFIYFTSYLETKNIKLSNEHSDVKFLPIEELPLIAAFRGNEFTPTDVLIMNNLKRWLQTVHTNLKVA